MPAKNNLNYSPEELLISEFGRAISHPSRSRMLLQLLNNKSFRNVDFSKANNISITTTHHHLYCMKQVDLVNLEYANHEYHATLKKETLDVFLKIFSDTQ